MNRRGTGVAFIALAVLLYVARQFNLGFDFYMSSGLFSLVFALAGVAYVVWAERIDMRNE